MTSPDPSGGVVVNIHDAKTHFSKLIALVEAGEEVVVARSGQPVAKLVPAGQPIRRRVPGSAVGKIVMKKNFDAPLPAAWRRAFE